jgi:hypothetical protein
MGQRLPHVACADDYAVELLVNPQYFRYFFKKSFYIVSVALLPESAEAVEILSYLGCCYAHPFAELLR